MTKSLQFNPVATSNHNNSTDKKMFCQYFLSLNVIIIRDCQLDIFHIQLGHSGLEDICDVYQNR